MEELLNQLQRKGVTLWLEGDKIRYRGAPEVITSELLQELRRYRPELVEFLRQANQAKLIELPPLRRSTSNTPAPATPSQARLWFLSRLEAGSIAYTIPQAFEIEGALNRAALQGAVGNLVQRHESLRTTLVSNGVDLHQCVTPYTPFELPTFECPGDSAVSAWEKAREKLNEWGREPFDLEKGPLFRARLLKIGAERHALFLAFHHAIADGWSLRIFYQELAGCYVASVHGTAPQLPDLPFQYGDFANALTNLTKRSALERELAYWKERLSGAPAVLDLPHDYPRTLTNPGLGAVVRLMLPASLWKSLGILSRSEGATTFMTLLAAFQVWLGRLAGVADIVVGSPVAGRQQPEVQNIIGLFLNNLALRGDLAGNPTFRELLRKTRSSTLDAFAHQDLPFDRLVTELNPERSLSHSPLFQVMINQLEQEDDTLDLAGLKVRALPVFDLFSKYDFTLYSTPRPEGTTLELVYNSGLIDPSRAREMLSQFEVLITQLVSAPDRQIREYSLITPEAAHTLPNPEEAIDEPQQESVMDRFGGIVSQAPHSIALTQGPHSWTYSELGDAIGRIAGILEQANAGPGSIVAVTGASSPGLVAAALATWQVGAVLTLVDPRLPVARKQLMAAQAGVTHWLRVGPGEAFPTLPGTTHCIDIPSNLAGLPATWTIQRHLSHEAYIFFTSGTTGMPKAVLGTHQGLGHFLHWQRNAFSIGPGDRVAQLTGLSFDVILRDLFLPLSSGATLCLPSLDGDLAADRVLPWLERERITVLHTVPSLAATWLAADTKALLSSLRWVFFAGEPLTDTLVNRWRATFPGPGRIVNLYGPTETTLAKLSYTVPDPPVPGIQPVGRPLPQTQAWILNSAGRLCGVGEPGEIVIRTPFRTRGYPNAPGETNRRFRVNPFRNDPADLVYYTGDRGRYRPDGQLDILGRTDRQVKIHGVRIELDEVNSAIAGCPGVVSSAVIAHRQPSGELTLVAYLSGTHGNLSALPGVVRRELAHTLPSALMPSEFIALPEMPLTSNGKINIAALPPPGAGQSGLREKVEPAGPVEETIAEIWKEFLPHSEIDASTSFFELGGHSLLAVQMIGRIRRVFGRDIPIRTMFMDPTVAGLARVVANTPAVELRFPEWCKSIAALQPGGHRQPLIIFPGGNGGDYELYVHARFAIQYLGLDQPVLAFKARGSDGVTQPHVKMADMVRDYLTEIRHAQPRGPYYFLGDCLGGNIAFTLACALQEQGENVPFLAMADCARPGRFEFERYWLRTRAKRFRLSVVGRILFNWHRLATIVTPAGRKWLREKLRKQLPASPTEARTPLKPIPALDYWSPHGERYRRAVTTYTPGTYRGTIHLILSNENKSDPALLAWAAHASDGIETHALPGDHWTYLWEGAPQLARLCRGAIDREIVSPSCAEDTVMPDRRKQASEPV